MQSKSFFGSTTSLRRDALGEHAMQRILTCLGLDPASLRQDEEHDRLFILRHTLMNPYIIDHENQINYVQRYFAYLKPLLGKLVAPASAA